MANLKVVRSKTKAGALVPEFAGFGAQYNQNVYSKLGGNARVTDAHVGTIERKLVRLKPHLVRLFFNGDALADDDLMQSFRRSVVLAQRTAEAINITFQGIGPNSHRNAMPQFAELLGDLVTKQKISKLRWVTVRNEPNRPAMPMPLYRELYQELDRELVRRGVRQQLQFMGGDLLINNQDAWFRFLATKEMSDLLAAWSIHVYWDYWSPRKIEARLGGVRKIWDDLDPRFRKPLYITEYGVRGKVFPLEVNGKPNRAKANPGFYENARTPLGKTNIYAFQHAWFALRAAKLGYHGAIKWDAYFGRYGTGKPAQSMAFEMIGPPPDCALSPTYHLMRLLTTSISPGSSVFDVTPLDGKPSTALVVGFSAPSGRVSVVGLDTAGGKLNGPSKFEHAYRLAGLPRRTSFRLRYWNRNGNGRSSSHGLVHTDAAGVVAIAAPRHSVFSITSTGTR